MPALERVLILLVLIGMLALGYAITWTMDIWNPLLEEFAPDRVHIPRETAATPAPAPRPFPTGNIEPFQTPSSVPTTKVMGINIPGPSVEVKHVEIDNMQVAAELPLAISTHKKVQTATADLDEIIALSGFIGYRLDTTADYECRAVTRRIQLPDIGPNGAKPKTQVDIARKKNPYGPNVGSVLQVTATVPLAEPQVLIINGPTIFIKDCWDHNGTIEDRGYLGLYRDPVNILYAARVNINNGMLVSRDRTLLGDRTHPPIIQFAKDHVKETMLIQNVKDALTALGYALEGTTIVNVDVRWLPAQPIPNPTQTPVKNK